MYPYLFENQFGHWLTTYAVATAVGVFAMLSIVSKRWEKTDGFSHRETDRLLVFTLLGLGVALFASYLFDAIFHFLAGEPFAFRTITFIGGLIGGLVSFIALIWFAWKPQRKNLKKMLDTAILGVIVAHAFGRIGCFLSGCCYGITSGTFLDVVFPYGESGGVPVLPTQLYEAVFLFLLYFFMVKAKKVFGHELSFYLMAYGTFRFLLEFLRGDNRGTLFAFIHGTFGDYPSPSQYLSLAMIAIGAFLWIRGHRSLPRKEEVPQS